MDYKHFGSAMKLFADIHAKRNTAFAVLLVWLFALASGVANACLLEGGEPSFTVSKVSMVGTGQTPAERAALPGASAGHDDSPDAGKEACLKVCDDGKHTLPTVYPIGDHTDPGLAPWFAILWTGSQPSVLAAHRMVDAAIPIVGLPLRVRYSRLAL
jgi:hypothetical protein